MSTQEISVLVKQLVKTARRRRRPPSQRNIRIHRRVRVDGELQGDVAILEGLSQTRVSAICRQVDRWRAEEEAGAGGEPIGEERQRADRWVARERLEKVYGWAMRGLQRSADALTSYHERKDFDNHTSSLTSITKDYHFDVRWAKLAKDSAEKLLEMAEQPQADRPAPSSGRRDSQADRIVKLVACLRRAIRQAASSGQAAGLVQQIVEACLPEADEQQAATVEVAADINLSPPEANYVNYSEAIVENSPASPAVAREALAPTDAAAATCDEPVAAAPPEQHAKKAPPETAFRIGSENDPRPPAAPINNQQFAVEQEHVLRRLTSVFGRPMRPARADAELATFLADQAKRHPQWSYRREQREALLDWQRLQREQRTELNLPGQAGSDTMVGSARSAAPAA